MHQIFQILAQVAQWCVANPANMRLTYTVLMGAKRGYDSLAPAYKAKVDYIMIQAAEYLAKAALGDVLGWARSEAVSLGLDSDAAAVAEVGVRRVAEVGLATAFEEMGKSGGQAHKPSPPPPDPTACKQCSGASATMYNTKCCSVRLCESCMVRWRDNTGFLYTQCEFCGTITW